MLLYLTDFRCTFLCRQFSWSSGDSSVAQMSRSAASSRKDLSVVSLCCLCDRHHGHFVFWCTVENTAGSYWSANGVAVSGDLVNVISPTFMKLSEEQRTECRAQIDF